jgi:hypothetical protein
MSVGGIIKSVLNMSCVYTEYLAIEAVKSFRYLKIGEYEIRTVNYADDLVLLTREEAVLQGMIVGLIAFYIFLTVHLDNLQLDALFTLNLYRQTTYTCFGRSSCPSSGGIHCIYTATGTCYTFRSLA